MPTIFSKLRFQVKNVYVLQGLPLYCSVWIRKENNVDPTPDPLHCMSLSSVYFIDDTYGEVIDNICDPANISVRLTPFLPCILF